MKNSLKVIVFYVCLIAIVLVATSVIFRTVESDQTLYSDIVKYFNEEQVDSFVLTEDNVLQLQLKDQSIVSFQLRGQDTFDKYFGEIAQQQYLDGTIKAYNIEPYASYPWWLSLLPYALVIIFFIAMWFYVMNQAGGKGGNNKIMGF